MGELDERCLDSEVVQRKERMANEPRDLVGEKRADVSPRKRYGKKWRSSSEDGRHRLRSGGC